MSCTAWMRQLKVQSSSYAFSPVCSLNIMLCRPAPGKQRSRCYTWRSRCEQMFTSKFSKPSSNTFGRLKNSSMFREKNSSPRCLNILWVISLKRPLSEKWSHWGCQTLPRAYTRIEKESSGRLIMLVATFAMLALWRAKVDQIWVSMDTRRVYMRSRRSAWIKP